MPGDEVLLGAVVMMSALLSARIRRFWDERLDVKNAKIFGG